MSDPGSRNFTRNLERKLDFTDAHSTNVPKPKENEISQASDEADIILDLDGWQNIILDEEDLKFLRQSLEGVTAAPLSPHKNLEEWAYAQKTLKASYRGEYAVVYESSRPKIEGYYVPNKTESARTEGVSKIPLLEKRKYLPQYTRRRDLDKRQRIKPQLQLQSLS